MAIVECALMAEVWSCVPWHENPL